MIDRRVFRAVLATLAVMIASSSCSDGADDSSVGETLAIPVEDTIGTEDGASVSADGSEDTDGEALDVTTVAEPTTFAELEQLWADRRAVVVDRLQNGGFGAVDGVLTGPGGLIVDLSRCPEGWADAAPAAQPIRITHVIGQAQFGAYSAGAKAYFDHVNSEGGVNGRLIDYEIVDDELVPTKTIEAVDDRIDSSVLGISTFGTPTSQAVFDQLNQACIPQPFVGSGHPAWGDPRLHPWTTGLQLSYATEAIHWGEWTKRNLTADLPVRAAVLVIDNDYGRAYQAAFERWAAANGGVVSEVVVVTHDPSTTDMTSAMSEVLAAESDLFLAVTAGEACGSVIEQGESAGIGETALARFLPVACTDPERFLVSNGAAGDGYLAVDGGAIAVDDPAVAEEPFVEFITGLLSEAELDADQLGLAGAGAGQFAWTYVEVLRIAAELDGGVTRSNVLLALRSLDLRHPLLPAGIAFSTDGADDAYPIEGARMMRYSSATMTWENDDAAIDLDGATPICSWDGTDCG